MSGVFSIDGRATNAVGQNGSNDLVVEWVLDMDHTRSNLLTGRVVHDSGEWVANLLGDLAEGYADGRVSPFRGKYTVIFSGTHDPSLQNEPAGDGFGAVMVETNGMLTLNGVLADGKPITHSVPISPSGWWPLYVPLYAGQGSLLGWIEFGTNAPSTYNSDAATVSWIRPPRLGSAWFPAGYRLTPTQRDSSYRATMKAPFTNGILAFIGGGLVTPLTNCVTVTRTNTVIECATKSPIMTLTASNGLFGGTLKIPHTTNSVPFRGAVLQAGSWCGLGFFTNAGQSGWVYFGPAD